MSENYNAIIFTTFNALRNGFNKVNNVLLVGSIFAKIE